MLLGAGYEYENRLWKFSKNSEQLELGYGSFRQKSLQKNISIIYCLRTWWKIGEVTERNKRFFRKGPALSMFIIAGVLLWFLYHDFCACYILTSHTGVFVMLSIPWLLINSACFILNFTYRCFVMLSVPWLLCLLYPKQKFFCTCLSGKHTGVWYFSPNFSPYCSSQFSPWSVDGPESSLCTDPISAVTPIMPICHQTLGQCGYSGRIIPGCCFVRHSELDMWIGC